MTVYRVPLKKVFAKKKINKDSTWADVYGSQKCVKCKQHFVEGDAYIVVGNNSKRLQHAEECVVVAKIPDRGSKPKKLPGLRKKSGRLSGGSENKVGKPVRTKKPHKRPVRRPV